MDRQTGAKTGYTVSYRNIRHPRLEFKTGTLLIVLPKGSKGSARMLEKYENFYTDVSSLLNLMKKQKEEYVEFMDRYKDKILLGTDGPGFEKASDYANFLEKNLNGEASRKIARENAMRFMGL